MANKSSGILLGLMLIGAALAAAGAGAGILPKETATIILGITGFLLALADARAGILLLLVLLYFPVLPNVSVGDFQFSVTTVPILGLGVNALVSKREPGSGPLLAGWQVVLLISLLVAFTVTTFTSAKLYTSILLLPNLYLYAIILFAFMVLIRRTGQLVWIAKVILLLMLVSVFWRQELRPVRGLFGFPSLGVNGHVFSYYAAVGLCLVIATNRLAEFSLRWRILAFFLLGMMALRAIQLETRSAWIAIPIIVLISLRYFKPQNAAIIFGILLAGFVMVNMFGDVIQRNMTMTQKVYADIVGEGDLNDMDSADQSRLIARDAAIAMFDERPVNGWGPNMYIPLKPEFAVGPSYLIGGNAQGSFNSWATVLAEMGILGFIPMLVGFLLPLLISQKTISSRTTAAYLAYGFAAGMIGYGIHLLFIDLLYGSFVWMQLGFGLASARIALESRAATAAVKAF